ncbi:uncharacterized protein LOC127624569 [Xyrauchen texanus]|uniref:uncharacterized protein LOC127624569 n=1 Tax=Xyrauchen texanus TaxID=154827 RepID=UPI0022418CC4|nr:uncharacterized protein LOC127624569 [Xyrauchen texanus]
MSCLYRTVVCILLMCMVCKSCSSSLGHRRPFSNSLRLTRTIHARVQQLLSRYKQQLFGGELFESRELMERTIPAVTVNYRTWLHMKDVERLRLASRNLQTFWTHLEYQRLQLEREGDESKDRREQKRGKRGRPQPTLCQSFMGLQIDLRDLMRQVNSQVNVHTLLNKYVICNVCDVAYALYKPIYSSRSVFTQRNITYAVTNIIHSIAPTETKVTERLKLMLLFLYLQLFSLSITQDPESTSTKSPILRPLHSTPAPNTSIRHPTIRFTPTSSRKLQTSFHTDTPHSSTHFTTESTSTSSNMKLPYRGLTAKPEKTSVGVTVTPRPPKPTQTSTVSDSRGSLLSVDKQQTTALSSGSSRWVQHLRGYVILRDLERYLSRLARDYTALQAKY